MQRGRVHPPRGGAPHLHALHHPGGLRFRAAGRVSYRHHLFGTKAATHGPDIKSGRGAGGWQLLYGFR